MVVKPAWFVALVAIGAMGCSGPVIDRFAQSEEAVDARGILDTLVRGDVDALDARIDDSIRTSDVKVNLRWMSRQFPPTPPSRVRMVGFNKQTSKPIGQGMTTAISWIDFESNYASDNFLSRIAFKQVDGGPRRLVGLHNDRLPAPLAVMNAFGAPHGLIEVSFLLVMAAVAAVTLAALVVWVRRGRRVRRRWWWLAGILVGAFKIAIDWKTGGLSIAAIQFQLFSLSAVRNYLDGPWILSFSIPAGAIAFLILNRRAASLPPPAETVAPPSPLG